MSPGSGSRVLVLSAIRPFTCAAKRWCNSQASPAMRESQANLHTMPTKTRVARTRNWILRRCAPLYKPFARCSLRREVCAFSPHLIVVDDHALELHAHLHDGREVLDAVERDLRDVQQPRHATDLHESSVRLDGLHVTVAGTERRRVGKERNVSKTAVVANTRYKITFARVRDCGRLKETVATTYCRCDWSKGERLQPHEKG